MKILRTASGEQSVKISKIDWQSIGKTAGWYSAKSLNEPDESNKYKQNYELYDQNSAGYSLSVLDPNYGGQRPRRRRNRLEDTSCLL